jgi:hypothetical protein
MSTRRRAAAVAVLALTLTACTSRATEEQPTPAAVASPTASSSDAVLTGPSGRTYRIRLTGDRTDVTLTGAAGENLTQEFSIPGRYMAPQVVPDGPLEGLSPDGHWLVLKSHAPAPNERSVFLILTGMLRLERETIDLPGRFTFDAWSPDGGTLYLIEHQPPAGSGHYVVRAYDMKTQSLRPDPVADKRNAGEEMAGQPLARATSPDGATVATLYVRQGDEADHGPFVHVLYTKEGLAMCVDLPASTPVRKGWGLQHASGDFVVTQPPGRPAFRIDAVSGELTPARG